MVSLKGYRAQLLRGVGEKANMLSCEVLGSVCKMETDSFISLCPPPPTPLPPPPTMNPCLPLSLARHSQGRPCAGCREGGQSQRYTPHTSPPARGTPIAYYVPVALELCTLELPGHKAGAGGRAVRNTQN